LEKIVNPQGIGPQVGSGELIGSIANERITIEDNKYRGVW